MTLDECREKIDALDYQIHDLLNERAKISLEVAKVKVASGDGVDSILRPQREQEIFDAVKAYNKGPYSDESILEIFKLIIEHSKELQTQYINDCEE